MSAYIFRAFIPSSKALARMRKVLWNRMVEGEGLER